MEVLSKETITRWLLPQLPNRPSGRCAAADSAEVLKAVCNKRKTGGQWR